MPANAKYLTKSGWVRASKITVGLLGGFFVAISFHLVLAMWLSRSIILITLSFSGFILWAVLFMIAFFSKKAWKVWAIYMGLIILFSLIIYFGKS